MRFYRLLSKVFPRAFRRQYEEELERTAADLMRAEGAQGRLHRARLWVGLSADAVSRGLAERRAERHGGGVRSLVFEFRQAIRSLASRPGFAAIVIGLLGLVMGANSAVFGVVNATLLRPLPFRDPGRLVLLWESYEPMHMDTMPWSDPDYESVRSAAAFENTAEFRPRSFVLTGSGDPASLRAIAVEGSLFDLLGITAERGRLFSAATSKTESPDNVVLSHRAWVDRLHSDPNVIGRSIVLDSHSKTVVGVLPAGVSFPPPITFTGQMLTGEPEVYIPYTVNIAAESRGSHGAFAVARLRPGTELDAARAEVAAIGGRVEHEFPDTNTGIKMRAEPLHGQSVVTIRGVLYMLLGAVGGVLLIACASISNLLLVRASGRTREMALRTALGASRASLVRQLLFESALLGVAGTSLGLLTTRWITRGLLALNPIELPEMYQSSLDARVLGFTILATLAAVFAFGLVPAMAGSRTDLVSMLRGGIRTTAAPGERRTRAALVILQVALAITLLVGSALMVRSLIRLWNVDPGFRPQGVTAISISLPPSRYADAVSQRAFADRWLDRVGRIPGVVDTAAMTMLPFAFDKNASDYTVVGAPKRKTGDYLIASFNSVSPAFTSVLHVPLIEGRGLTSGDAAGAPLVAVVNESLARLHWAPGQAVGHQLLFGDTKGEQPKTIVGVVGDVRADGFDGRIEPTIFVPVSQSPASGFWTAVASSRSSEALTADLRAALKDVDPTLPIGRVRPLTEIMGDTVKKPRFAATVLSAFAVTALLIAALGLYGVLAFDVTQQRREMGVRVALGATPASIRGLVFSRAFRMVAAGLVAGAVFALAGTRAMSGLLFNAPAIDLVALGSATGLLALTTLIAVWLPARRATRADPIEALRSQ
jgi:putative ABC transport system permease protein